MKKGIIGFLAVTLCFAGLTGIGANGKSVLNSLEAVGNYSVGTEKSFTDSELQKLLALKFDNYCYMTISKFQSKVWAMTDTPEYMVLLERLSKNETLYQMKDSDKNAAFLFYVLEPLTKEKWQTHTYSGAAVSDLSPVDGNARLEYSYTLNILNPDKVMVKDYCDMRLNVTDAMRFILYNRTKEELQNEELMRAEIGNYIDEMLPYLSTEEVGIEIEYAYFPMPKTDEGEKSIEPDNGEWETRFYSHGTEEDYNSLLTLKKSGYENMQLADFNRSLLDWANEDYERFERIDEDTKWDDFLVDLTDEELSFVKLTVSFSGMENGKAIQSARAVTESYSPYYGEYLPQKTADENGFPVLCSLYYQFSYSISDPQNVTVGGRDNCISNMISAVRDFWNGTDIEKILKMDKRSIAAELRKIAAAHSTDNIKISVNEERMHLERMDERQSAN